MRTLITGMLLLTAMPLIAQQPREDRRFQLPGVEFTEEQQAQADQIRKKYEAKFAELAAKQRDLFTPEQRRARRAALEQARDAGKSPREAREAAETAVKFTEEQRQQEASLRKQQTELMAAIRKELTGLLTAEQQKQLGRRGQPNRGQAATHPNVKYGPHERNVMDVWLAESDQPTPVLVSIHGGGFRAGNKSVSGELLKACLEAGISVVAITYRLSQDAIAPAQHHDAARAIQFIRSKSKEWNLDPQRFAATGGSAGAGLSMWLAFHDDLANPEAKDPVLRESSRLRCAAVFNGQTSYDPRFIRKLFPENDTYQHSALAQLYDVDLTKLDELPPEKFALMEEVSALPHLSKGDAPVLLQYASKPETPISNQSIGIHHPRFGKVLKEQMDELGIECIVSTGVTRGPGGTEEVLAFIKKHLAVE